MWLGGSVLRIRLRVPIQNAVPPPLPECPECPVCWLPDAPLPELQAAAVTPKMATSPAAASRRVILR
jgi:hypothetical protein